MQISGFKVSHIRGDRIETSRQSGIGLTCTNMLRGEELKTIQIGSVITVQASCQHIVGNKNICESDVSSVLLSDCEVVN